MNKIRKGLSASTLLLAGMMLGASPAAHAGFVNSWNFTIDAKFLPESATGTVFSTTGNGTKSVTDQIVSWGSSSGSLDPALNTGRSGLKLGNDPSSGTIVTNGSAGNTLTVTHVNNSISGNYATLRSTVISSTLTLTPVLDPAVPSFPPATIDFGVKFSETENSAPCAVTGPGTSVCNDIFVLTSGLLNSPFTYDGEDYFLNIVNISGGEISALAPLPPNVCIAAGAPSVCLGFTTNERDSTTVQFAVTITGEPLTIPEPGVLTLFGLSLVGLASVMRRPRK